MHQTEVRSSGFDAPSRSHPRSPLWDGAGFAVGWTGPNAPGDYVTIVMVGATQWTDEPYFNTNAGSPGQLVAPTTAGDYELWYVSGTDDTVATRRPITVTEFVGTLRARRWRASRSA